MNKLQTLGVALLASTLILVFAILFALPTMFLWNWALQPAIDGVNSIGFFQAMGINLLAGILFKGASVDKK